MIFNFLTTGWGNEKSGIEHAILERIKLFEKNNIKYRLVTVDPDLYLHEHTKNNKLDDKNILNLFDFFGNDINTKKRNYGFKELVRDTPIGMFPELEKENKYRGVIKDDSRIVKRFYIDKKSKNITSINEYDSQGHIVRSELFDSRGWPALEIIYDIKGRALSERYRNSKGKIFYQTIHRYNKKSKGENTLVQLFWKEHIFSFQGFNELRSFFYDVITFYDENQNTFIVDRTNELAYPVLNMTQPIVKYAYLHSDHINSHKKNEYGDDELIGSLNPNYEYALNNLEKWDGILMSTKWQKKIFKRRYHSLTSSFVIPVGYIPENVKQTHIPWNLRKPFKVICMARLSPEKQHEHLIRAFQIIAVSYPEAVLELWGFDNGEKSKLEKIVKECKLENNVKFCGYTENTDPIYNSAQVSVLTSNNEGFSLSLLESIAHGCPTIAYKVPYGSKEIISDNKDGFLVEKDNINEISIKLLELLENPEKAQEFSEEAYRESERFSEKNVFKKWEKLFMDAETKYRKINVKKRHYVKNQNLG